MLIKLRNKDNKLLIKDLLDIDFDMYVRQEKSKYYVMANSELQIDTEYDSEQEAEEGMINLAQIRNDLESELDYY